MRGKTATARTTSTTHQFDHQARTSGSQVAAGREGERPLVSVVVPTKNERENVIRLIDRLEAALPTVGMEIVFVDASTDGTAGAIEEMGARSERDVVLVRQSAGRRNGGLGAAVLQGLRAARAPGRA